MKEENYGIIVNFIHNKLQILQLQLNIIIKYLCQDKIL